MLALLLLPLVAAESYPLVESYSGTGFFDGWNYPISKYDNTTNGDVFWATTANTSVYSVNDAGHVIMKVDDGFVPYNEKRWAPKLVTKNAYPPGTIWVMDAVHMPYGCSVWPALWTQGPDWPKGGEIDIMEGIHNQVANQMALHSEGEGCYASADVTMAGTLGQTNCSVEANFATGCTVADKNDNSYGAGFAAAKGGVFVTEFALAYIKIWFISRANVPATLTADAKSIDTTTLGEPTAYYPASTCDFPKYFGAQTLTLDITLCGSWGGIASTLEQTCPALVGDNTCYTTYVINNGTETYKNAYFELNYVNIYSNATAVPGADNGGAAGSGSAGSTSAGTSSTADSSASGTASAASGTTKSTQTSDKAATTSKSAGMRIGTASVGVVAAAIAALTLAI